MMTSLQQLKVGCRGVPGKMPELPYLHFRFGVVASGKRHRGIRALRAPWLRTNRNIP
jgi:hypothetical protein